MELGAFALDTARSCAEAIQGQGWGQGSGNREMRRDNSTQRIPNLWFDCSCARKDTIKVVDETGIQSTQTDGSCGLKLLKHLMSNC